MQQIGLDAVLNNVPDFTAGINKMNQGVDSFAQNSKAQGEGFAGGFGEIVTGALRHIGELAIDALGKAARAVGSFVKDSIGLAGDFQANMLEFQSVAGKDVDTKGLQQFRDLFIDIGKRLPVSTSEVQQAAIEMVKGGIDPATIAAGGLEQNIKFAAAAMDGDLVKAAEISSKILGGWTATNATAAEKADFLTHSTDLLAKAANASSTDVEGLSRGIFQAQGIAKTAGVSFDDLTTTLAELAPRFGSSAEAGTSLKNLIARLQPTTDPATEAMAKLGLYSEKTGSAFYDAQGNFVGFQQASQLLQTSLQGLTKEQQAAALQTIFGNDAMSSASALAELGAQGYDAMAQSLANANGVQEAAALKQQGFNTALDNAKGSVEALQITLGSALLPALTDLLNNAVAPAVNAFTDWVSVITSADDPLQELVKQIDQISPILGTVVAAIADFVTSGGDLGVVLDDLNAGGFADFLAAATPVASFLADNLKPILFGIGTAITVAVVPALVAATTAFITAAAPIAALVAAGALLYKAWTEDWGSIQEKTKAVWDFLEPVFNTVVDWLEKEIPKAIKAASDFWDSTLLPALKTVGNFIESTIFPILGDLAKVWLAAAAAEIAALEAVWSNVLWPALKAVGAFISDVLAPIFKALFDVEFAIASKVVEALAGLWQKVLWPALQSVGDYMSGTVIPVFKSIGDYLNSTFGPTLQSITSWLEKVTGGFGGVSGAVQDVVQWIENLASSISTLKLPDWLTPGSPTPWEIALRGIGNALQTSVAPGLSTMQQGMRDIGATITDTFQNTDIIDALTHLGEDAMAGFGDGLKSGLRGIKTLINSTADTVEGAFQDAFGAHSPATRMMPLGGFIIDGITSGIAGALPSLYGVADQVALTLTSHVKKMGDATAAAIAKTVQDIKDQVAAAQEAIANLQIDTLNATANIDRQKLKNLKDLADISKAQQAGVTQQLEEAQQQAAQMTDPAQAAAFFKQRSAQVFELAKLNDQILEATAAGDTARREALVEQYQLINAAQNAETQALQKQQQQGSATTDIIKQLQALLANQNLPGLLESPVINQLNTLLGQLVSPPSAQPTATSSGATTTTNTTNLNMPIYTNNSPGAMQQSMAVAMAGLI